MANHSTSSNVVGIHYRIGKQIGEGSFGIIFEGINLLNQQQVAIKFEPRKSKAPQLYNEYCTYKALVGCSGVPNVYYFGPEGMHNILIIDLLGPSLEDLFGHCNRKFTVKTVVMIGKQMLSRIQAIHEKNLVHRDIKPENFLRRPGTLVTSSILPTVFLPWQGLRVSNEQKYAKIGEMKQTIPIEYICNGLPREFNRYLIYVRNLGFEDTPDYDYLRGLLTEALKSVGEVEDGGYDWTNSNNGRGQKVNDRQGTPNAIIVHHRSKKRHSSAKRYHLTELLPDPIATRSVPGRNWDQAASCQAQFQHSRSYLNQIQYCATPLQSTNSQQLRQEREHQTEGFMQTLSKILCCNPSRR
ncbi:uncharacterized protein ALTATR162_LOCUS438 [Alternaria atra]|uniref:Protein kinase domain-containing protein n=1 Tax=Alternaria atra TaxID=119953 RepID=A0A8J2HV97_9PLEO|nr:uncharacterized protein ALTATR162_LOCUS438 [Alternaria atra]CAG5138784.1 unnamed protein product [Alternaria atra]